MIFGIKNNIFFIKVTVKALCVCTYILYIYTNLIFAPEIYSNWKLKRKHYVFIVLCTLNVDCITFTYLSFYTIVNEEWKKIKIKISMKDNMNDGY